MSEVNDRIVYAVQQCRCLLLPAFPPQAGNLQDRIGAQ